ncbi:MAG TPA: zf-HC2 domain-containing protein [Candidatus Limnocylindrales bacterium]|nr:zf-HC2 domain-containing protein [Candidatus Limnocylindrales bacterium]
MKRHEPFLELAAIGIDFPLTSAERARLDQHLAVCPACARAASGFRADAAMLERLPIPMLPERRAAEVLATVLHPQAVRHPVRLLAIAALLGLALLGSLAAGAELLRERDRRLVVVPPLPTGSALAPERPGQPSQEPAATSAAPSPALGSTWSSATVPDGTGRPSGPIEAVTAGGPGFVAVGRGCMGTDPVCEAIVWTSVDGRAWARSAASEALDTGASFPTSGPQIGMFDVAAGDPGIVAIGYAARPGMEATAWFSPDGASWERIPLGGESTTRVNAVAFDGRRFVIVGEDRSALSDAKLATATARAAVWTSEDGRTWNPVPGAEVLDVGGFVDTLEDPWMGGMADVTAGPGGLVAVGSVCEHGMDASGGRPLGCEAAVWRSLDGRSWERAVGVTEDQALINAVATSEDGYIAVGTSLCGRGTCPGLVLTSPDAETWTTRSFPQPGEIGSVTSIGDRIFATTPFGEVQLWTSADGAAWEPADVEGGPTPVDPGGDVQLAAGDDAAVWIGTPGDGDRVVAWVSTEGGPDPAR